MKKLLMIMVMASSVLAGCSSPAKRMSDCEEQGVSRDACYVAEQNRQSSVNSAAQKQAMENAQSLYPVQKAQSGHRANDSSNAVASSKKSKEWEGMKLVTTSTGLTVDGKPAAEVEKTAKATVYQQGLFNYIVYSDGKIGVTDSNNVFKGYAK